MSLTPREVLTKWVAGFNARDAKAVTALYHEDAVNHQVSGGEPVKGRAAIEASHVDFFKAFPDSYTKIECLVVEGEWAALEWSGGGTFTGGFPGVPPTGKAFTLRGCGFFRVVDGKIKFQRGYWDKQTWFSQIGLPV